MNLMPLNKVLINDVQKRHIVIEGIDGSGKDTVIEGLRKRENSIIMRDTLKQMESISINEDKYIKNILFDVSPWDKELTIYIRSKLKERNEQETDEYSKYIKNYALLKAFIADNMLHAANIRSVLKNPNNLLISNRYWVSTIAYQSINLHMPNVISELWRNTGIERPGLIIYLDISPEESIKRINARGETKEIFEKVEILKKVHNNYEKAFKYIEKLNVKWNEENKTKIVRVDASLPSNDVCNQVEYIIKEYN